MGNGKVEPNHVGCLSEIIAFENISVLWNECFARVTFFDIAVVI